MLKSSNNKRENGKLKGADRHHTASRYCPDLMAPSLAKNDSDFSPNSYEERVWVEHPELGYAPGRLLYEVNSDEMQVEAADGYRAAVSKANCVVPIHQNSLQGVSNLLDLGEFSMAALLHNIRVRYNRGEYYSSIGLPILLSVNPYKPMPSLYDAATRRKYQTAPELMSGASSPVTSKVPNSKVSKECTVSPPTGPDHRIFVTNPHLFGTAQMTYSSLIRNNQAQSIVISGESGAGKTEATKILLRYFSEMESPRQDAKGGSLPASNFSSTSQPASSTSTLKAVRKRANESQRTLSSESLTVRSGISIETHTLRANPILEAFGNAKTVRNDNSSRFGKFIQIYFDLKDLKRVKSAKISHYLLEKCRLVSIHPPERTFHIFYALLFGGIQHREWSVKLADWGLDQPYKFQSMLGDEKDWECGDEYALFMDLLKCVEAIGFSEQDVERIFAIIGSLLHLSTASFVPAQDPSHSYTTGAPLCEIADIYAVEQAARLLSINHRLASAGCHDTSTTSSDESMGTKTTYEGLLDCILFKSVRNAEGRGSWIQSGRSVEQAAQVRDGIIKEIYSRLFSWIVRRINSALDPRDNEGNQTGSLGYRPATLLSTSATGAQLKEIKRRGDALDRVVNRQLTANGRCSMEPKDCSPAIGLLDIYGFEVFEGRNSFEQLCINYANEKLQQHFNLHVLALEQKTYRAEEIDWSEIQFSDNKDIIKALEEPPHGVFVILDDTRITDKNKDFLFLQRLDSSGVKSVVSLPLKKFKTNSFIVKHYAGIVDYDCEGFVDKNQDKLELQCCYFLSEASSSPVVRELFPPKEFSDISTRRNSLRATVSLEFRNQLDCLMASLTATCPTYVRCIKPNGAKQANNFDSIDVLRQLKYAGLLESIRIRHSGFGIRCTFSEFLRDYSILDSNQFRIWWQRRFDLPEKDVRKMCHRLLSRAMDGSLEPGSKESKLEVKTINDRRCPWQLGKSKVFMKEEVQIRLERCRNVIRNSIATRIQACANGFIHRRRWKRKKAAALVMQTRYRQKLARRYVMRFRAALTIQSFYKYVRKDRQSFVKRLKMICIIQKHGRGFLQRKRWRKLLAVKQETSVFPVDVTHSNQQKAPDSGPALESSSVFASDTATGETLTTNGEESVRGGSLPVIADAASSLYNEQNIQEDGTNRQHVGPILSVYSRSSCRVRDARRRRKKSPSQKQRSSTGGLGMVKSSSNPSSVAPSSCLPSAVEKLYEQELLATFKVISSEYRKCEKNYAAARREINNLTSQLLSKEQKIEDGANVHEVLMGEINRREVAAQRILCEQEQNKEQLDRANMSIGTLMNAISYMESIFSDLLAYHDMARSIPECRPLSDSLKVIWTACCRQRDCIARLDCYINEGIYGEFPRSACEMPSLVSEPHPPHITDAHTVWMASANNQHLHPMAHNGGYQTNSVDTRMACRISPPSTYGCDVMHYENPEQHLQRHPMSSSSWDGRSRDPSGHFSINSPYGPVMTRTDGTYCQPPHLMTMRSSGRITPQQEINSERIIRNHFSQNFYPMSAARHRHAASQIRESDEMSIPAFASHTRHRLNEGGNGWELYSVASVQNGAVNHPPYETWRGHDLASLRGEDTVQSSMISLNMKNNESDYTPQRAEHDGSSMRLSRSGINPQLSQVGSSRCLKTSGDDRHSSRISDNSRLETRATDPYLTMGGKALSSLNSRGPVVRSGASHGAAAMGLRGQRRESGVQQNTSRSESNCSYSSIDKVSSARTAGIQTKNLFK